MSSTSSNLRTLILLLSLAGIAALLAGCSSDGTPIAPASIQAGHLLTQTDGPVAAAHEEEKRRAARSSGGQPSSSKAGATPTANFAPPFPHRQDMFEPPKRAQASTRRTADGEAVELKGFVKVDHPRVVLAIDGVITPLPEGGEKYGVEVISIQPPSVVLQRGRNRWTATLE